MRSIFFALSVLWTASSFALPHLDLEMTSDEYRAYLQKQHSDLADPPSIAYALKFGERLSKWIALINETRTPETAIRLTSATTRRGIPIETPNVYSPATVERDTTKVMADLPATMKDTLLGTDTLPTTISIDDETFIKHGRLLDNIYQTAARYKSVNPYRFQYTQMANQDVRGYYYLTQNKIGAGELKDVASIPADKLVLIKSALVKICLNAVVLSSTCTKKIEAAVKDNKLDEVYTRYFPKAKQNWDEFFIIPKDGRRSDVVWANNTMTVPFNTPSIAKFIPYLQDNIQDEFRFGDWKLLINFGVFSDGPKLVFKPGVVPHVNGLGGNEIVMDSNQPIEEYESQWTIRHEFGHVIGLPDCYHEFFDVGLDAFVNYQLDVTDLMCSRAGNMKERIYTELKKTYE